MALNASQDEAAAMAAAVARFEAETAAPAADTAETTASAAYVNSTNDAGPVTIFGVIDLSNGLEISSS